MPAWAIDEVVEHWPGRYGCGHVFDETGLVAVGEPARHQVEERPPVHVVVTEHRGQRVRCPGCERRVRGALPAEVAASAFGPRLHAAVAVLSARNRISRRDVVVELCEQLFGSRVSSGTVDPILSRVADALEEPCDDLLERVRAASALNMDETGWRTGDRRAFWGAFTDRHGILQIAADRHEDHAKELLGDTGAIVTSDRWWAYSHLPLRRRQVCWAHLKRDFQAQAEGLGAEQQLGEAGLRVCEQLCWAWEVFQHTGDRA